MDELTRKTKGIAIAVAASSVATMLLTGAAADSPGDDVRKILEYAGSWNATTETAVLDGVIPLDATGHDADEIVKGALVTVPTDPTDGVTVAPEQGDTVIIGLPEASGSGHAKAVEGVTTFEGPSSFTTVVAAKASGAVQIATILESELAPERYSYDFSGEGALSMQLSEGWVLIFNEDGGAVGGLAPPWAVDSEGGAVPTHYEIDGSTVTQVVEHVGKGVTYPVTADPTYSWQLLDSSTYLYSSSYGSNVLTASPSAWGRAVLAVSQPTFAVDAWALMKAHHAPSAFTTNMVHQWDCHIAGGWAELGTFDMEKFRSVNYNWRSRIGTVWPPSLTCNW